MKLTSPLMLLIIWVYFRNVLGDSWGLEIDSTMGDGFGIDLWELQAKIDLGASTADTFYLRDGKYICQYKSLGILGTKECCLEWDHSYESNWGADESNGRAAEFNCNGGEDLVWSDLFATSSSSSGQRIRTYKTSCGSSGWGGFTSCTNYWYCLAPGSKSGQSHSLGSGEVNLYWRDNEDSNCLLWNFNNGKLTTTYQGNTYAMEWDGNLGSGFEISSNERVAKMDTGSGDYFYIRDGKYICSTASRKECCMEWDGTYYSSGWGSDNAGGRAAKFDCSGGEDYVSSSLFDSTPNDKAIYSNNGASQYCLSVGSRTDSSHSHSINGDEKNLYWRPIANGGCLQWYYTSGKFTATYDGPVRNRKFWHELNTEERDLYITGFNKLYEKGYLNHFAQEHQKSFYNGQAHYCTGFFPWHRYYLYEFESQIRDLGGKYEDFSLPMWDWTHDSDTNDAVWDILQQGLGGANGADCITGTPFDDVVFTDSDGTEHCIVRDSCAQDATAECTIQSAPELMADIIKDDHLLTFRATFAYDEPGKHAYAHKVIGGTQTDPWSPTDPIFWLLHCYTDFVWTVWQNCHGYDQVDKADLTGSDARYDATGFPNSEIDTTLMFAELTEPWTYLQRRGFASYTLRELWSNEDWDVKYDGGSFFTRSTAIVNGKCNGNTLNTNLFSSTSRRRLPGHDSDDDDDDSNNHLTVFGNWLNEETKLTLQQRAKLLCIYDNMYFNRPSCPRPKHFDDCSDRNKYPIDPRNGDIDITLDELIEKVKDYQCMVDFRKEIYSIAKMQGELLPLCNGYLDSFSMCDREWITKYKQNEKQQQQNIAPQAPQLPQEPKININPIIPKMSTPNIDNIPQQYPPSNVYTFDLSFQWLFIYLSVLVNIIFIFSCITNKCKNNDYSPVKYLSETENESV